MSCLVCERPSRRDLCVRCYAAYFRGLRVVDEGDDGAPTVVAIGYPPSLREVIGGDDEQ